MYNKYIVGLSSIATGVVYMGISFQYFTFLCNVAYIGRFLIFIPNYKSENQTFFEKCQIIFLSGLNGLNMVLPITPAMFLTYVGLDFIETGIKGLIQ